MIFSDVYGAEAEPRDPPAPARYSVLSLSNENQGAGANRRVSASSSHALQGLEDDEDAWKNISEVVRLSFKEVLKRLRIQEQRNETLSSQVESLTNQITQRTSFEANRTIELERKLEEQGSALRKVRNMRRIAMLIAARIDKLQIQATAEYNALAGKIDLKADSAYVTDCLLTKANKSDLVTAQQGNRSDIESTSNTTTRILVDQLRSQALQIENKADKAHCQIQELSQVQSQMQKILARIESQLSKFALVAEVNKCLELKANKVAVANALHRKANKENVAQSIRILESKVEHTSPSLQQEALVKDLEALEKKVQRLDKLSSLNASAIESLPSIDKVSSGLNRLHTVVEKQLSGVREDVLHEVYKSAADLRVEVEGKMRRSGLEGAGDISGTGAPEKEEQEALAMSSAVDLYRRLREIEKACERCLDVSGRVDLLAAEVERIRIRVGHSGEGGLTGSLGLDRQGFQGSSEFTEDYRSWLSGEPTCTTKTLRSFDDGVKAKPRSAKKVIKKKKKITKKTTKGTKRK